MFGNRKLVILLGYYILLSFTFLSHNCTSSSKEVGHPNWNILLAKVKWKVGCQRCFSRQVHTSQTQNWFSLFGEWSTEWKKIIRYLWVNSLSVTMWCILDAITEFLHELYFNVACTAWFSKKLDKKKTQLIWTFSFLEMPTNILISNILPHLKE